MIAVHADYMNIVSNSNCALHNLAYSNNKKRKNGSNKRCWSIDGCRSRQCKKNPPASIFFLKKGGFYYYLHRRYAKSHVIVGWFYDSAIDINFLGG